MPAQMPARRCPLAPARRRREIGSRSCPEPDGTRPPRCRCRRVRRYLRRHDRARPGPEVVPPSGRSARATPPPARRWPARPFPSAAFGRCRTAAAPHRGGRTVRGATRGGRERLPRRPRSVPACERTAGPARGLRRGVRPACRGCAPVRCAHPLARRCTKLGIHGTPAGRALRETLRGTTRPSRQVARSWPSRCRWRAPGAPRIGRPRYRL